MYFITEDPTFNIKLRKPNDRKPSVKLRILRNKCKEFELWHTEIDKNLPAPPEVWNKVLAKLKIKSDIIEVLSKCTKPSQVKQVLFTAQPSLLSIEIFKDRTRYIGSEGEVEVVTITIDKSSTFSISFESKSVYPNQVLKIHTKLKAEELGDPKSYTEYLLEKSSS